MNWRNILFLLIPLISVHCFSQDPGKTEVRDVTKATFFNPGDFNLGGGYLFAKVTAIDGAGQFVSKHAGRLTTVGQLNLGFWLNKRDYH